MKKIKENWLTALAYISLFFLAYWLGPAEEKEFIMEPNLARLVGVVFATMVSLIAVELLKNIARLIADKLAGRKEEV